MGQVVKNLPAMRETWVQSLVWEDPLEKGTATHSGILAWRIPWTVQSVGLHRVGHNWATFIFTLQPRERGITVIFVFLRWWGMMMFGPFSSSHSAWATLSSFWIRILSCFYSTSNLSKLSVVIARLNVGSHFHLKFNVVYQKNLSRALLNIWIIHSPNVSFLF